MTASQIKKSHFQLEFKSYPKQLTLTINNTVSKGNFTPNLSQVSDSWLRINVGNWESVLGDKRSLTHSFEELCVSERWDKRQLLYVENLWLDSNIYDSRNFTLRQINKLCQFFSWIYTSFTLNNSSLALKLYTYFIELL